MQVTLASSRTEGNGTWNRVIDNGHWWFLGGSTRIEGHYPWPRDVVTIQEAIASGPNMGVSSSWTAPVESTLSAKKRQIDRYPIVLT
jgi:hypothetical protein